MAQINIFPNPVIGVKNDFNDHAFDFKHIKVRETKEGNYRFKALFSFNNLSIENLISDKIASAKIIIQCNNTLSTEKREIENNKEITIDIPKTDIYGDVIIYALITMNKESDVKFDDLNNNFYPDNVFKLFGNDVIGKTTEWKIKLYPTYVNDTPIQTQSIWDYKRDDDAKEAHYKTTDTKIEIYIPREEYVIHDRLQKKNKIYNQIFRIKYMLPVLADILNTYCHDRSEIENLGWYPELHKLLEKTEITGENAFVEAQVIMREHISGHDSYGKTWKSLEELEEKE